MPKPMTGAGEPTVLILYFILNKVGIKIRIFVVHVYGRVFWNMYMDV